MNARPFIDYKRAETCKAIRRRASRQERVGLWVLALVVLTIMLAGS